MNQPTDAQQLIVKRWTVAWSFTVLMVFLVLVFLGMGMRFNQAGNIDLKPDFFYAFMTLHGLGMAGTLFTAGLAMVWYLLGKYVQLSTGWLMWLIYVLVILAVLGLLFATWIGRFGPGWYVLYPLPFIKFFDSWAIGLAIVSVMALGFVWLLWQLDMLRAMAAKYGLSNMMGWQYLGNGGSRVEIPPVILIATISLIAGAVTTVCGVVLMVLYLLQWLDPAMSYDPLLLKNMVFLFGHTIVNASMYFAIAVVYELLPAFTGRPWKTNKIVVISWNVTFALVLVAFLHHLYMDFAQPLVLQYIGQFASYLSAVPATVVTVFGVIAQVYRSGTKWDYVPLSFLFGVMGWIVGGLGALVDSTIMVNYKFHNTLWVPAHFHTYFIVGYIFILFGFVYFLLGGKAENTAKLSLWTMMVGGYGFLAMFYVAGVLGVPRRYANYQAINIPSVAEAGETTATISILFIGVLVLGILIYLTSIFSSLSEYEVRPLKGHEKSGA